MIKYRLAQNLAQGNGVEAVFLVEKQCIFFPIGKMFSGQKIS
jgi:hypothetical protein